MWSYDDNMVGHMGTIIIEIKKRNIEKYDIFFLLICIKMSVKDSLMLFIFIFRFFYIYDAHNGQDFSWNGTCTLIRFNTWSLALFVFVIANNLTLIADKCWAGESQCEKRRGRGQTSPCLHGSHTAQLCVRAFRRARGSLHFFL